MQIEMQGRLKEECVFVLVYVCVQSRNDFLSLSFSGMYPHPETRQNEIP